MRTNAISNLKTVELASPNGPRIAMLMGLDIPDPDTAHGFIGEAAEKLKLQRMCSPPETDTLLLTIVGNVTAARFAERWRQIATEDPILQFFMSQLKQAEVLRGTADGTPLESVSLLDAQPTGTPPPMPATGEPPKMNVLFAGNVGVKGYDSEIAYQRWRGQLGAYLAEARQLYARRKVCGLPPLFSFGGDRGDRGQPTNLDRWAEVG